ncbi:DUF6634 family protein [Methylobacterium brachythecii]|uniref:Uncharacterized protein n=1 Tax=Methylobacterium brachythecii TaxID=1176177 RepID=A0A7W6AGC5_9HYPH|nr:DUF6634 family protein [Methylobacterium brachythecii]MBB3902817.1 hypothetical protein [Methylobacterium brachythecii]GLS43742.1 hypothetical protein GCM10007884_17270 [Methylobacterium brachythecii]
MVETISIFAAEIGAKLIINNQYLRPVFFDAGAPLENGPLASQIQAIAEGREPIHESLAAAPTLNDWWQVAHPLRGYFLLVEQVTDHSVLGSGTIHTSAIRSIFLDRSCARTTSWLHGLGTPRLAGFPSSTTC